MWLDPRESILNQQDPARVRLQGRGKHLALRVDSVDDGNKCAAQWLTRRLDDYVGRHQQLAITT